MPLLLCPTYRCINLGMEPIKVPSGMNLSKGANRMLLACGQKQVSTDQKNKTRR